MPCDKYKIIDGLWYRFQGDAGSRMPSTCPDSKSCGAYFPGWLDGVPPTVKYDEKQMMVYFRKGTSCNTISTYIQVKNCGAYTIYGLVPTGNCNERYCGTD